MIPDNLLKAVIIPLFTAVLWLPAWGLAESGISGSDGQPGMAGLQENRRDSAGAHPDQPGVEMAATVIPSLPHINALEPSPGKMEFIPLNHVFFDHNKATLNKRSMSILDDAAQYVLLSDNIARIIIHGHANSIAGKDYNDRLSDKRANAVKNYLLKKKIPAELMWVTGWGENDPIDENWIRTGSQRNRRVEIYLVQYRTKE